MATDRRSYTEVFKREAVRLMETSGKPITEIVRKLGINDNNLYRWRGLYDIQVSMGNKGDPYDNVMVESFFSTLGAELADLERFPTRQAARTAVFEFTEVFTIVSGCIRLWAIAVLSSLSNYSFYLFPDSTKPGEDQGV
ncbi:MAG: transposase [Anaerolineae bacterium]|nr:transposase [Anaerolineae bacterium]